MECVSPACSISLRYSPPAYWLALSEWWISPTTGPPAAKHHRKGVTAKLCAHVILYGPANNLARSYTLHTRQIKPAFVRVEIGGIGQPNGIGIRQ